MFVSGAPFVKKVGRKEQAPPLGEEPIRACVAGEGFEATIGVKLVDVATSTECEGTHMTLCCLDKT